MSQARSHDRLELPESLRAQLHDFRRRVWVVKTTEAACVAASGVALAFLSAFALDRFVDTPGWARAGLLAVAAAALGAVPFAVRRWGWGRRRPEQLARLLARRHPHIGDQLLGVIELVRDDSEQARSRSLCEAAVKQTADDARGRDFRDAVPAPRRRRWAASAGWTAAASIGLLAAYPDAASNAWARLVAPWGHTPRYTFAAVEPLPARLVVAHGEPFAVGVRLGARSARRPARGLAQFGAQAPVSARLVGGRYEFAMPAQISPGWLDLRVGDWWQRIRVEPTLRPELTSVVADVRLPDYLGRPGALTKDVRGGSVSLVLGSLARFAATASRPLAEGQVDGRPSPPAGATLASPEAKVDGPRTVEFRWRDALGLAGREPFTLAVNGREDEAPTVSCEDLPRQKVVLDTERLAFKVKARDDFGVARVGLEWQGAGDPAVQTPAKGERVLAAGGHDQDALEAAGTFSAKALGIEPQPVHVRVYAEDYLPGRPRVYSPAFTLYVLDAEQHAIWVTEQMSRWHRASLEVRDREMQLFETNKEIRALPADELDRPETRRKVENQAEAERANGRRLSGLVDAGEDLVRQAMRNPEVGVGHLETWAEMLQILKDISAHRMPSVADLLKQAAQAPALAVSRTGNKGMAAGQSRAGGPGKPSAGSKSNPPPTAVPQVVDRESSQMSPAKPGDAPASKSKGSAPRLLLPKTTLVGPPGKGDPKPPADAPAAVDEAVVQQQDLLAEFEKIAEELNRVLANLEGSTLVKRLKAASRTQANVAGRVGDQVAETFGVAASRVGAGPAKRVAEMAEQEAKGSHDVSVIMDDMASYFERRRYAQFKTVLDEMKAADAVGSLRQLGDDLAKENGVSIAQCEYWSDTLDRWAEDLVDPACKGTCPGSKSKGSLPPSIVLEVLQILEAEVGLREETRVAEQARPALAVKTYAGQAGGLSKTQGGLRTRVEKVVERILDLKDGESEFAPEIRLLGRVAEVMGDAAGILARPETGGEAIAAETEAIELLLQSKRINPKGGGGGGSNPGGGGKGTTDVPAIALVGSGMNPKEVREDRGVSQATGDAGPSLPEEFRAGLDEYFNRLERRPGGGQ